MMWLVLLAVATLAAQNRIDLITPAAPELAAFGPHAIGVRTLQATDRNRPDVLNIKEGGPIARYDRTLTLEVWYPAALQPGQHAEGVYRTMARTPAVAVTLRGRAVRDAEPERSTSRWPLVIVSHGYPGNRYLMSHLGENLASKGFVVVSIDHRDSTYDDQQAFASTLYNRPLDQQFVLNELARLDHDASSFLRGRVDASRTGIVGYSMGGYGVVNLVGGGFSRAAETMASAPPNRMLAERGAANAAYRGSIDARLKAAVAIGPWGMQNGFWDAEGLKGIRTPLLLVAGSVDTVSGYENGTRAIYTGATNAPRHLLTFLNAGHNAAAPIPPPFETLDAADSSPTPAFAHYADPVWDNVRMNNILAHFATAFFDRHLKGDAAKQAFFDLIPNGRDGVFALDRDGQPTPKHTYWRGFRRGTAVGLVWEQAAPVR